MRHAFCDESAARGLRQGMVEMPGYDLLTENRLRKASGHLDLWTLATILGRKAETELSQEV
jgi:hypothetical protein